MLRTIFAPLSLLAGIVAAQAQPSVTLQNFGGSVGNVVAVGPTGTQITDAAGLGTPGSVIFPQPGTAAIPSLSFGVCGTNCGIFAPTASQLGFTIAGTRRLDFGIGTAGAWTFSAAVGFGNNQLTGINSAFSNVAAGWQLGSAAASGTVATLIPNRGDTTTGIGAAGNAKMNFIVSSTTQGDWGDTNASAWTFTSHVFLTGLTTSAGAQTSYICQTTNQLIAVAVANTCATSSIRFKQDIAALPLGLDAVMALQPIVYHYKLTGDDKFDYAPGQRSWQLGFTAEQAASVDPRLITYEESGQPHAFRYEQYVAVLTRAIQEQQEQIDELRRELRGRH